MEPINGTHHLLELTTLEVAIRCLRVLWLPFEQLNKGLSTQGIRAVVKSYQAVVPFLAYFCNVSVWKVMMSFLIKKKSNFDPLGFRTIYTFKQEAISKEALEHSN